MAKSKKVKNLEMTPIMILAVIAFFLIALVTLFSTKAGKGYSYMKNDEPKKVIVVSDEDDMMQEDESDKMETEVMEK